MKKQMTDSWLKTHHPQQQYPIQRNPLKNVVPKIEHDEFIKLMNDPSKELMILDVRDDDAVGGHIRGAHHFPESLWQNSVVENGHVVGNYLLSTLFLIREEKPDLVIVHCMESAVRGPHCADLLMTYLKNQTNVVLLRGGADQFIRKFYKTEYVSDYDDNIWGFDFENK